MRATRQGIVIIEMRGRVEDVFIDVPVFPSLGCLPVKPERGERLRVTGNLGMYSGQPQLRPLSAAHVELAAPPADSVSVGAAVAQVGARLLIGPLTAVEAEFFESPGRSGTPAADACRRWRPCRLGPRRGSRNHVRG